MRHLKRVRDQKPNGRTYARRLSALLVVFLTGSIGAPSTLAFADDQGASETPSEFPGTAGSTSQMSDGQVSAPPLGIAPLSMNPPGTRAIGGLGKQKWYAYAKAGEVLQVSAPARWWNVFSPDGVKHNVGGQGAASYPVNQTGVWIIEPSGVWRDNDYYDWDFTIVDGAGSPIDGRIWSKKYYLSNSGTAGNGVDLDFYFVNDSGYTYDARFFNQVSGLGAIEANSTGWTQSPDCLPSYESRRGPWVTGGWNIKQDCGDAYRVFFEPPAADLPVSAPSAEGELLIKPTPLTEADVQRSPLAYDESTHTLSWAIDSRFSGQYVLEIDKDGDGVFETAVPQGVDARTAASPDGTRTASYVLDLAGFATCAEPTARLRFDKFGEIHFLSDDVEFRNGLRVTRVNGPGAPDSTLYWDDRVIAQLGRDTSVLSPKDSEGNPWVVTGVDGADSSAYPEGVHGWTGSNNNVWGGWDVAIDDWTYYQPITPVVTDAVDIVLPFSPSCAKPALTLVKSVEPTIAGDYRAGQEITYSFAVRNSGNVTLRDVSVNEMAFTGAGAPPSIVCPAEIALMAPKAEVTCSGRYVLQQDDIDAGVLDNTARAVGEDANGTSVESNESSAAVTITPAPSLSLVKASDTQKITEVGQKVTYSFEVTNTGNTSVSEFDLREDEFSGKGDLSTIACPSEAPLLPGQKITCTATYAVVAADLTGMPLTNTASVNGESAGTKIESRDSTVAIATVRDEEALARAGAAFGGAPADAAVLVAGARCSSLCGAMDTGEKAWSEECACRLLTCR